MSPSEKNNLARGGANGQWRSGDEEVTERKTLKPLPVDASAVAAAAGALHFAPSRVTLPMMTAVVRSLRSPGGVVLYVDNVCALLAALIGDKDLPSTGSSTNESSLSARCGDLSAPTLPLMRNRGCSCCSAHDESRQDGSGCGMKCRILFAKQTDDTTSDDCDDLAQIRSVSG